MRILSNTSAEPATRLAECESRTAGPMSAVHLRRTTDPLLRTTGGIHTSTLCGREIDGWDVRFVTADEVRQTTAAVKPGTPGALCVRCVGAVL